MITLALGVLLSAQVAATDCVTPGVAVFSTARISPRLEGGRALGLEVWSIRSYSLFACLGVQEHDMIISYNGLEASDRQSLQEMLILIRSEDPTSVVVVRNGKKLELVPRAPAV